MLPKARGWGLITLIKHSLSILANVSGGFLQFHPISKQLLLGDNIREDVEFVISLLVLQHNILFRCCRREVLAGGMGRHLRCCLHHMPSEIPDD